MISNKGITAETPAPRAGCCPIWWENPGKGWEHRMATWCWWGLLLLTLQAGRVAPAREKDCDCQRQPVSVSDSDLLGLSHPAQPHSGLWSLAGRSVCTRTQRLHCLGRRHPAEQVGQLPQPSKPYCFIREQPLDPVHACLAGITQGTAGQTQQGQTGELHRPQRMPRALPMLRTAAASGLLCRLPSAH